MSRRMSQWRDWEEGTECPTALRGRSQFITESASNGGWMLQQVAGDGSFHTNRLSKLRSGDLCRWRLEWLDLQEETQFFRTRSSFLKAAGSHCELWVIRMNKDPRHNRCRHHLVLGPCCGGQQSRHLTLERWSRDPPKKISLHSLPFSQCCSLQASVFWRW